VDRRKWFFTALFVVMALSMLPDLIGIVSRPEVAEPDPALELFDLGGQEATPSSEADLTLPPLMSDQAEPRTRRLGAKTGQAPFNCMIEPSEFVEVGSALTAILESIAVERGDVVEAGQILAKLESEVESSAVEAARARASMDGDIQARLASLHLGNQKRERAERLFNQDVLSVDLKEETETEAEVARATLLQAQERKELAKLDLAEAADRLAQHTIRSPISGVVVELVKSPGEVVKEETILSLARLDPLRVQVILPPELFGSIEKGMQAEVEPELQNAGVRIATVTVQDAVLDAASGTFGVRLELPNSDQYIPSGQRCQVRFLEID
jgi:RND family efflux transporter MFP subunit